MNMSDNDPQTAASDPPILIQGGGSIEIDVPASFQEQGGAKRFKNEQVNLVSLQINEDTPIQLNKGDKISITYK
jgi:hypothetical protein